MRDIDKDYPIVRKGLKWEFRGEIFWFRKSAENARANFLIFKLAGDSFIHHVRLGTRGY